MAADNKVLGQFDLIGIPPSPRGMPQIEVTFDIDANGIVNVSAKDKATGKEQQIRIQASGGLSDADIETMVKDAEQHAGEDKQRRELVEARNQADSLIHTSEKNLTEFGDKISEEEKTAIEEAVTDLKGAMENDDAEAITAKTETLAQASMKLGEAMYKASQESKEGAPDGMGGMGDAPDGEPGAEGQTSGGAPGDDATVVDADFEEVNPESEPNSEGESDKDKAEESDKDKKDS